MENVGIVQDKIILWSMDNVYIVMEMKVTHWLMENAFIVGWRVV